jgi:hypothetical protein
LSPSQIFLGMYIDWIAVRCKKFLLLCSVENDSGTHPVHWVLGAVCPNEKGSERAADHFSQFSTEFALIAYSGASLSLSQVRYLALHT